jgi:protein-tyrosine phosphatase
MEHHLDCSGKVARQITLDDYHYYDMIVAMDRNNLRNLQRLFGLDTLQKISLLMDYTDCPRDVADPWYTGDFETAWQDILEGCSKLLQYIMINNNLHIL